MQKNYVRLVGFLGFDPELMTFESGKKLLKVNLATNDSYKNPEGEWVQNTQWHQLMLWDNLADKALEKFKKGVEVVVEGRIINKTYVDKEGVTKFSTEIGVSNWLIVQK